MKYDSKPLEPGEHVVVRSNALYGQGLHEGLRGVVLSLNDHCKTALVRCKGGIEVNVYRANSSIVRRLNIGELLSDGQGSQATEHTTSG